MRQELVNVIRQIIANKDLIVADEASIKAGAVLRLLQMLGWDSFDVDEVTPEYSVGGRRVDFALRVASVTKVFVEVKRAAEDLEPHQEQLLSYSFSEGVKMAALTNGTTWWLYLPLSEGSWEQRRFYSLDLREQDSSDVATRFVEFLSKDRVASGEAAKTAEQVYRSKQKKTILRASIPKAWNKLLTDPDDLLVDLLIETTEKLCGFRPDLADMEAFLKTISSGMAATPHPERTTAVRRPLPEAMSGSAPAPRPSNDLNFIGKNIESFVLFGKTYYPKTWQELLLTVSTEVYRRHPHDFPKCLSLRGSKMIYFSKNPNELSYPKQIDASMFYAEAKLSSNSIIRRSRELLALFGHGERDLEVRAR